MDTSIAAVWGFLVGFVGWMSCFRSPESVAAWLMAPSKSGAVPLMLARLLVTIFLILATFLAIALLPMLIVLIGNVAPGDRAIAYKNLFGIGFTGSFAGLIFLGLLSRSRRL